MRKDADNSLVPKYDSDYGNYVKVEYNINGMKYSVIYGHMNVKSKLKVGSTINPGDVLGYSGDTGKSTGPHVHIGVKDEKGNKIDPRAIF